MSKLLLLLLLLGACAAPCTWEGDTCLELELLGQVTLRAAKVWLGLRSQAAAPPGNISSELQLPRSVTMTLPLGISAGDVLSVRVCGQDNEHMSSYAGTAAVQWTPGSQAAVSLAVEPIGSSECIVAAQEPVPMEPPSALPELHFSSLRMDISGLAPLLGATLGDFYDDQRPSLAALGTSQSAILLFPAVGDGGFGPATIFPQARLPDKLVAADLKADGHSSLLGPRKSLGVVLGYSRSGKGHLDSGFQVLFSKMGSAPADLALADLTGDHLPELILANDADPGEVQVSTTGGKVATYLSGGRGPTALAVADLDGDGWRDVAVANRRSGEVQLLLNDQTGMLLTGPTVAQCTGPVALNVADYNGDQKPDIAVLCPADRSIQFMLAKQPASGALFARPSVLGTEGGAHFLLSGDFNRDGHRDMAVLYDSGALGFALGDGRGSFSYQGWPVNLGSNPTALLADDLNGDGLIDLLLVGDKELVILLNS